MIANFNFLFFQEWQKQLSKEWQALEPSEKNKYHDESKRLQLKYLSELEKWEEKMISLGHVDIVRTEALMPKAKSKK